MKRLRPCAAALVAALSLCASASYAQIVPFDTDRWEMNANEARVEDYRSKTVNAKLFPSGHSTRFASAGIRVASSSE